MDEYPNSSEAIETSQWVPEKPKERKEAERKEQEKVASSVGVIDEVLKWLEKNAEMYATVDALNVNDNTPAEDIKLSILLSKKMRAALQGKAAQLKADFADHFRRIEHAEQVADEA